MQELRNTSDTRPYFAIGVARTPHGPELVLTPMEALTVRWPPTWRGGKRSPGVLVAISRCGSKQGSQGEKDALNTKNSIFHRGFQALGLGSSAPCKPRPGKLGRRSSGRASGQRSGPPRTTTSIRTSTLTQARLEPSNRDAGFWKPAIGESRPLGSHSSRLGINIVNIADGWPGGEGEWISWICM